MTLTIDADVADRMRNEVRRTAKPLTEVVNDALRKGLARHEAPERASFRVRARPSVYGRASSSTTSRA